MTSGVCGFMEDHTLYSRWNAQRVARLLVTCSVAGLLLVIGFGGRLKGRILPHEVAEARGRSPRTRGGKGDGTQRQTARVWTGPATEFDYPGRDQTLQIELVMDALNMHAGSVVADIGAGGGWFTMQAAKRVGPTGRVYGEEILPRYTSFIAERARRAGFTNVRTILGTTTDPRLPAASLDAALILNAYHEFEKPLAMLRKISVALKHGGRLGFIERDTEELRREARAAYAATGKIKRRVDERNDNNPYTDDHRLAREIVEREAASAGFRHVLTMQLRDDNYLVVVARG